MLDMLVDPSIRLREAIIKGNLLVVKRLLRRFPELLTNINPENGWSSLHYASYYGRYLICVYLIQCGHDKQEVHTTFKGNTCAHLSLMNGHEQTTHLLLQYFPRFIDWKGYHGRTLVHIACQHDHFQCFNLLMVVGANLTIRDDDGDTPLHVCLEYGSVNCMKMLVSHGTVIDDNVKNKKGWKPSEVASTYEMAKLYMRILKDAQISGNVTKPNHNSYRTPTQSVKAVFDDGPSPVLALNSPYSIYSQNGIGGGGSTAATATGFPTLPRISTSRRASSIASSKSPIAANATSRFTSKDSSIMNSPQGRDTVTNSLDRQAKSSVHNSPNKRDSNQSQQQRTVTTGTRTARNIAQGNTQDLANRYLSENSDSSIFSYRGEPTEDMQEVPRDNNKGRSSVLNVQIAKLRGNDTDS